MLRTGVADPSIAHRKRSSFYIIEEGETEEGEEGFWVVDEDTGEEGFTGLYTKNEFWVLCAKGSYSKRRLFGRSFKKGRPKGYGRKERDQEPASVPGQKVKGFAAWEDDRSDSALWGKRKYKGKGKKGRKGMKGQDSFKGVPGWKGKGKGESKGKGGKPPQQNPQQANIAQQATSSSPPVTTERQETAHVEENLGYDDAYWSSDWSEWDTSYCGYDEYDWYSWPSYYVLVEEQAVTEDRHAIHFEDGQNDPRQYCFSVECSSDRVPNQSIRNAETSVASDSTVVHTTISQSNIRSECVLLNYDHGAQQALLCEYVDLGSHPAYVILDSGFTRAMGSRFAIGQLVQACQRHPKHDHIWFSTQPCSSKFSFANGEQSTVKERLVIHFRHDRAQNGWITTCVDILDKGKIPILFSVELRMNIEHTPVGEFLTCPLFGMQRTALSVSTSNHPVLDSMALATSSWKPMCSFASEETTRPARAGKHRPHTHTYKEGCKKKPATKKEEPKPAKTTTAKPVLKKILSPDTKLEVPEKSFEDQPMKSSGQSSGSKDGIPARQEPQPEEEHDVKTKD